MARLSKREDNTLLLSLALLFTCFLQLAVAGAEGRTGDRGWRREEHSIHVTGGERVQAGKAYGDVERGRRQRLS